MEILHPHERKALAQRLHNDMDAATVADPRKHSWRLGPSSMDTDCDRKVWYGFRWVKVDIRDARMTRLLEHGHIQEPIFEAWIKATGTQVWTVDPNASPKAMNKQYRVRAVGEHVGGYLDGIAMLPEDYKFPYPLILELKTSGTGKGFNDVAEKGVEIGKPSHAIQAGFYGWKYQFRYSLYLMLNKNDHDLTVQIIENDYAAAAMLEARMYDIVRAEKPPRRISENATDYRCKMCRFHGICHQGGDYEVNCRSCDYAEPIPGGEWQCNLYGRQIPRDVVKVGCANHHPVGR